MSSVRFTVTKADEGNYGSGDMPPEVVVAENGDNKGAKDDDHLMEDGGLPLYESETNLISKTISKLANYDGGVVPLAPEDDKGKEASGKKEKPKKTAAKLGTILGVYFPCMQNIFGVLMFVRLVWIVGNAGFLQAFLISFLCCACTFTTSISLSAIATNGVVSSGGSYFLISRALGPEFGGAVGLMFYVGTSVAASMYIVGSIEIFLQYICPMAAIFKPMTDPMTAANNYRIYGSALLFLMFICVFIGVKFVSKIAPFALFFVIMSVVCIYIGIFVTGESRSVKVCFLGDRLLALDTIKVGGKGGQPLCDKNNDTGPIYEMYCGDNDTMSASCEFYHQNEVRWEPAIPGLLSGVISENIKERYTKEGNRIGTKEPGDKSNGDIINDITTTFLVLIGIYFPSVTGIMAGSNRSGDLADAQKSLPRGTIAAQLTTSFVYLSFTFFFAACIRREVLMDKFGESIGGSLIVANLAWPHPMVVTIGAFLSTMGAGLQSLMGAPRLLQAITKDGIVPFLSPFSVLSGRGEPFRALLLTTAIIEAGVLIAVIDYITPIITMFFLMCYTFVNVACVIQSILKTPNWRPRYKYYHWIHSLFGVFLCLAIMFMTSWYYALLVLALALAIYKYIEYKGAEKEWGDGIRGLAMSAARYSLLKLQQGPPHVKNWRPQVLILLKLDPHTLSPLYPKMLTFCSQLKAGKGLTLVASVIEGHYLDKLAEVQTAHESMAKAITEQKVKGFGDILVARDIKEGLDHVIQMSGVGGLKHNSVLIGWPYGWRESNDEQAYKVFVDTLRSALGGQNAVLIPKNIDKFPENGEKCRGNIDIWWIVHDGGLLMLLPFLLLQHNVWSRCKMRIFTVAQVNDNSIQIKSDLEKFVYQLRIKAEVQVIEMAEKDISAYTYERTVMMEQRTQMLKEIRAQKEVKVKGGNIVTRERASIPNDPQIIVDSAHQSTVSVDMDSDNGLRPGQHAEANLFTFTPAQGQKMKQELNTLSAAPESRNVRRMHTAVHLNEKIVEHSHDAALVILNLPTPPKLESGDLSYMEFMEVLTEGLDRVLLIKGSGREVITIFS